MYRIPTFLCRLTVFAALAFPGLGFVCLTGCSEPASDQSGPSYADLVAVYNSELQALDRLERKRGELVANHEAAIGPSVEGAAKALESLLSSAGEAGKQLNLDGVTDPNELLDRAVEHAEKTQDITSGLLESVGSVAEPSEEEAKKRAELTEQFERNLADIDKQIAEQKTRVDRAREARDTAEAAQE